MTTAEQAPNPPAEQRQALAERMHEHFPGYMWNKYLDAADAIRAHNLLSEGAPSEERRGINLMRDLGFDESAPEVVRARADAAFEEQIERAARALFEDPNVPAEYAWDEMVAEDPSRADIWRDDARRVLTAAGVAPQEPQPGKRLDPEFRAELVDIAKGSIQDVWNDVPGGVDAETLAQNVVGAQEFVWISRGFPVAPQGATGVGELPEHPTETPESGNVGLDREKVRAWLQREFGSVLAHDPHNPERFWGGSADALCVALTEGKLT